MFGLLDVLGFDVGVWAILLIAAWYLFRSFRGAKKAGSLLGTLVVWITLILLSFALATMFSWADLNVGKFMSDVGTAAGWFLNNIGDIVADFLGDAIEL